MPYLFLDDSTKTQNNKLILHKILDSAYLSSITKSDSISGETKKHPKMALRALDINIATVPPFCLGWRALEEKKIKPLEEIALIASNL